MQRSVMNSRIPIVDYGYWKREHSLLGIFVHGLFDDEGQIANVAVLPEYRRKGIGKLLVQHALQEARKQGVRSLSLEVRRAILRLWIYIESFGFEKVAVRKRYYENGEDALLMICEISL